METQFSAALQAAISGSGHSLQALADQLKRYGTPVSSSTIGNWQTGANQPEKLNSIAALMSLEAVLGIPRGTLVALLPPRRPRGRGKWRSTADRGWPHRRMWRYPEAVDRVLAKLDATPEELYRPARVCRQTRLRVGADGQQRDYRVRQVIQAGREPAVRLIALLGCQSMPQPPRVAMTEGCHPGRFRVDLASGLCAFELVLDPPLAPARLGVVEYTVCLPPGQTDNHHELRVQHGAREVSVQVAFDPVRRPVRCTGFRRAAVGLPDRPIEVCGDGSVSQFVVMDPAPGIYGITWDWE